MTEPPTEHTPKMAALRAEAAGLLSGEGRARLLKHVARCEICAEHLRGARRFHAIVSRATGQPVVDESGAVQRVMVRNRLAQRRARVQWGGLAVAAGVLIAVLIANRGSEDERVAAVKPAPPPVQAPATAPAESALLTVTVTALRGDVKLLAPASAERALSIEDAVLEHGVLRTGAQASVDLALGEVANVHVGAESELALDAIRSDRVALRLTRGEVSNAVAKRAPAQSYEVLAAGHRVAVRGTLFAVRAGGLSGLAVRCDEGVVEIIMPNGESALLRAPASWNEHIGAADAARPAPLAVVAPYAVRGGAVLTLPRLPGMEVWEIGGAAYPADTELKMRVPPGVLELGARLGDGRREVIPIEVDAVGRQITPKDLPFVRVREPAAAQLPEVEIDASKVILEGRPALQRCYERSLKNESSGSQALRLSIAVDPRGRVRKVEPAAQNGSTELPAELARCIRTTVLSWRFPAPGGDGLTLEAPLRFQLRR